jgi:hypothetical protein
LGLGVNGAKLRENHVDALVRFAKYALDLLLLFVDMSPRVENPRDFEENGKDAREHGLSLGTLGNVAPREKSARNSFEDADTLNDLGRERGDHHGG